MMNTIFISSLVQKIIPLASLPLPFLLLPLPSSSESYVSRRREGWASEKDKKSLKTGKGEERDKAMCFFTGGERRDR